MGYWPMVNVGIDAFREMPVSAFEHYWRAEFLSVGFDNAAAGKSLLGDDDDYDQYEDKTNAEVWTPELREAPRFVESGSFGAGECGSTLRTQNQ